MNRLPLFLLSVAPVLSAGGCIDWRLGDPPPDWPFPAPTPVAEVVQVDEVMQVTSPKVDVLWTIDNSGSMGDEQQELAAAFPLFMDFFLGSGLDYHVGVTTTDIDGNYNGAKGTLVNVAGTNYIDADLANPVGMFSAMATVGTRGSSREQGSGGVFYALEINRDTANAGFARDDAAIHTVVISDEADQTRASLIETAEFIGWYGGLKPEVEDRTFSSIVDLNIGRKYVSLTEEIGGISWSLLDEDWTQVLEQLGVQAAGLRREYFLSRLPVEETLLVRVEDVSGTTLSFTRDADWTYDAHRNSITFVEYVPNALSTVVMEYTVLASLQGAVDTTAPLE